MATRAVIDAAITFCEESLVLREKLDAFPTVSGTAEYDLDNPQGQQVARVLNVFVNGRLINPIPSDRPIQIDNTTPGQPTGYYTTRVDSMPQLCLSPIPNDVFSIVVEVALRPVRDTTVLQDDLYTFWLDTIVSGALSRLMGTPAQPFTDEMKAGQYGIVAAAGARKARVEGGFGRVKTSLRVYPRSFA